MVLQTADCILQTVYCILQDCILSQYTAGLYTDYTADCLLGRAAALCSPCLRLHWSLDRTRAAAHGLAMEEESFNGKVFGNLLNH